MDKKFAIAINCMDGRAQIPVINYLKEKFKVDYVDMVTELGPNKILSDNTDLQTVESIKEKVKFSVLTRKAKVIVVVSHYNCAGNLAGENDQKQHLRNAVNLIKEWNLPVETIEALWFDEFFRAPEVIV